jgi:hypothetical protein
MSELEQIKNSIDAYIDEISEKHRMHRKIQFLLDIRGLLIINKISGSYLEFGVYRGEMMYAAAKVLKNNIDHLYGFDTFEGLPQPKNDDAKTFVFESPGFMSCPEDFIHTILADYPHTLVKGDFRENTVIESIQKAMGNKTASVVSIDCNWPSSVLSSLETVAPYLTNGSIIYFDDYFVGTRTSDYMKPIKETISKKFNVNFMEFKTYAPCARAYIIEKF